MTREVASIVLFLLKVIFTLSNRGEVTMKGYWPTQKIIVGKPLFYLALEFYDEQPVYNDIGEIVTGGERRLYNLSEVEKLLREKEIDLEDYYSKLECIIGYAMEAESEDDPTKYAINPNYWDAQERLAYLYPQPYDY